MKTSTLSTLPGHPHIVYNGATLQIEQVTASSVAEAFGTPTYVYSRAAIEEAAQLYSQAAAASPVPVALRYAVKANSTLAVLQLLARLGWGFDIVSGGELKRVLAAGGDAGKVVFSGVGKSAEDMRLALDVGVECFNVESPSELAALNRVAQAAGKLARVALRVNPDVDAGTHPYISTGLKTNKFGISQDQAAQLALQTAQLDHVQLVGIASHIGSQITTVEPYLDALDKVLDLVEDIERKGAKIAHIDLGGGLGIRYTDETPPTPHQWLTPLLARITARGFGHRTVVIEPGRSIVGNAGVLLTRTLFLKSTPAKHFAVVDAGMNDLIRPALYSAEQVVAPAERREGHALKYDIVGPVCESADWLARDRALVLEEGDLLAILSSGAYGMVMASNYNSRGRPAEVMVDGAATTLIRPREATEQLYASERLLP
ncbi:diaminopimelate decarboxylase [Thiomonas intermedia]|uniref:diaminopimelate decarboxylase n=1 Tax=Thiomonas intermedia TaxID=926 RepID=UPI0009A49E53|nr:diaminopimelate decarboxylase [Thiomonas intermedia]